MFNCSLSLFLSLSLSLSVSFQISDTYLTVLSIIVFFSILVVYIFISKSFL